MLDDKNTTLQIFGCLLKRPSILGQTDKYILSLADFHSSFERKLFGVIYNLYDRGAKNLGIVDIENFLKESPASFALWEKENGTEYLQDAEDLSELDNFDYYYNKLKKINILRGLKKIGYDISNFYSESLLTDEDRKINERFDALKPSDIMTEVRQQLSKVEKDVGISNENMVASANNNIRELMLNLKQQPDVGPRLQGKYFNSIVRGARRGKFYLRTAPSGTGKTRQMIGDACYLAYPIRYSLEKQEWEWAGGCEKVLYIATEQELDEIQTMIVAYLSGVNENKILFGNYNEEEEKRIQSALWIMDKYSSNLQLARIANPNISQLQYIMRQQVLENNIGFVFYDYIFSNPALLNEFRDLGIREDVCLGLLSAALKDLAVELNIFLLSSTQTNAQAEDSARLIKNESVIRGARSIVDKVDMGCVMARPTEDELHKAELHSTISPNLVTDIYKMRRGRYTQVRIWSRVDLGTCRKEDLFVTDAFFNIVKVDNLKQEYSEEDVTWEIQNAISQLNSQELQLIESKEVLEVSGKIMERKDDLFAGLL